MDWLFNFFQTRKQVEKLLPSCEHFLNKRTVSHIDCNPSLKTAKVKIRLQEKGTIRLLSKTEFENQFEVEFLKGLYFPSFKDLKKVVKNCLTAWKFAEISALERWLGSYFEKELAEGLSAPMYIKWISPHKGYGLFAYEDLPAGSFIGEYAGIVRRHSKRLDEANPYCFEYPVFFLGKTPYTIDAKDEGNLLRFINHSYRPNLYLKRAYSQGIMHIILRAKEDIAKGCELTYDYGPNYWRKRPKPL